MKYACDRILFIDVETTGLVPGRDRVIEIGIVETVDEQFTNNNLQIYFNPGRDSDPEALAVHGITSEFLSDKNKFAEHAEEILAFLRGAHAIVMHNAIFDTSFLSFELEEAGYEPLPYYCRVIKDSLQLAREIHPNERNDLTSLCKRHNVSLEARTYHGALVDSFLLAQALFRMLAAHKEHESAKEYLDDLRFPEGLETPLSDLTQLKEFVTKSEDKEVHDRMLLFLEIVPEFNRLRKEQEENQYIFLDEENK